MSLSLSGYWRRPAVGFALLAAALAALTFAPAALAGGKEGWGRFPSFIGRYHARVLVGGKLQVVGGQLNMFPQEEFPGSVAPAGILKLRTKAGNNDVVYLTELTHRGRSGRLAVIKGGSFLGPTIGSFGGRMLGPGKLKATFSTHGLGTVKAVFTRYSKSPTP